MKKLRKILLPIDFSEVSKNAVQYANKILDKLHAEVVLVYVNSPENLKNENDIADLFKSFEVENLKKVSFKYEFLIARGSVRAELINTCIVRDIDLIITGTKGNRPSDLSIATSLIRDANCPVIVVPQHYKKHKLTKIAYATDYKPIPVSEAIKPLWEFALEFQAKVFLVHINYNPKGELVLADDSESTLEYYLESVDHEYIYIKSNDMEEAINDYILEKKIDLLVVLSRDHGSNQTKSENKLIAQLAAHSEVPILALC